MVLEAAVNGRAAALVTHNVRYFTKSAARFGLWVLRPGDYLKGTIISKAPYPLKPPTSKFIRYRYLPVWNTNET